MYVRSYIHRYTDVSYLLLICTHLHIFLFYSTGMAEALNPQSSTLKSKTSITGYFLLHEIVEDRQYHNRLITKYNIKLKLKIDNLDEIEEYSLSDVAAHIGVSDADENEPLALSIINKCLGPIYEYRKNSQPKIGGIGVSHLKECYISANPNNPNRGDVMVSYDGSDVLYTEVHSDGTYDCTARKTVYLLMECLRMLKAFGVKEPKMDAFVFPRKEKKRCVVRLRMQYLPDLVEFQYSIRCLEIRDVWLALTTAVQSNKDVCENLTNQSPRLDYILWLTDEERGQWGYNLHNVKSGYGILLMNNDICLKKPISSNSFEKLAYISRFQRHEKADYMPTYSIVAKFVKYDKICHDPLTYEEARRCCYELVIKIYKVTQSIHNAGYMHNDLQLPNICFNLHFEPILIDFDFATFCLPHEFDVDMEKFADEMVNCFERSQDAQNDPFIQKYAEGMYVESLLEKSIVATGESTVRSIIIGRNVS